MAARRWVASVALLILVLGLPGRALAQSDRYAVIVQGVSGDDTYAALHRGWVDGMVGILRGKLGFDAAHLTVLAEKPKGAELPATAVSLQAVAARLAKQLKPDDLLFIMLIGHGGGEGPEAKFNMVGPDPSVSEWNALLTPIPGRVVFVDATSSSFPFMAGLAAPGRVIITATSTYAQKYHTVFADGFIKAFSDDAADLDHNGRISIWEAFTYATRQVAQYYEQGGHMSTEKAILDDTGKGVGRDGSATSQGSSLAGLTYLDATPTSTSADPALQALLDRQRALTEQVDELRRRKAAMAPADFDQAFEKLIVDLAMVSRDIRRKGGLRF
jgi:hypothetical protein